MGSYHSSLPVTKRELGKLQQNCFLWPDLQHWNKENNVGITKRKKKQKLGISTKLNVKNEISYHIIEHVTIKTDRHKKLGVGDWIIAVGGSRTTEINEKGLAKLIKENGKEVCLSTKKPILGRINNTVQWLHGTVELKTAGYVDDHLFGHFYTDQENADNKVLACKDELIQEVSDTSTMFQLRRGDELISVNGVPVKEKTIEIIYREIRSKTPSSLEIKRIVFLDPDKTIETIELTNGLNDFKLRSHRLLRRNYLHIVTKVRDGSAAFHAGLHDCDCLVSVNSENVTFLENSKVLELIERHKDNLKLATIAAEGQEEDSPRNGNTDLGRSGDEDEDVGEGSGSMSGSSSSFGVQATATQNNKESDIMPQKSDAVTEGSPSFDIPKQATAAQNNSVYDLMLHEIDGATEGLSSFAVPEQATAPQNNSGYDIKSQESDGVNEGSISVGDSKQATATQKNKSDIIPQGSCASSSSYADQNNLVQNKVLCITCIKDKVTKRSSDKTHWPINMVCVTNLDRVCELLDQINVEMNVVVFAEVLGFSPNKITTIRQKYSSQGGVGAAKEILEKWSRKKKSNNVGKLREIVTGKRFQRDDVCDEIDEWLNREDICHGCGADLAHN